MTLSLSPDLRAQDYLFALEKVQGEEEVCDEEGTWEVCMCDVWVRVRVCENAGIFIYGVCKRGRGVYGGRIVPV